MAEAQVALCLPSASAEPHSEPEPQSGDGAGADDKDRQGLERSQGSCGIALEAARRADGQIECT